MLIAVTIVIVAILGFYFWKIGQSLDRELEVRR